VKSASSLMLISFQSFPFFWFSRHRFTCVRKPSYSREVQ
jgi:hypothetical protein